MENPNVYIPIAASLISLFSAIFVALMSIRNARKIEDYKSKENYYNFKIKQLMDEYYKYNPIVSISGVDPKDAVRPFESRFADCRLSILRVRPLLSENALSELDAIDSKYNKIILDQYNADIHNEFIAKVDAGDYIKMLESYMQKGHKILQKEILDIRRRFEVVS